MLGGPNHGFMNLKGFTVLEMFTLPLNKILTLWNRSSSRPTLIEFLPASVEDVVISGPTNTGLASLVLDELADAKEVHLPRIKSIHMSHIENSSRTKEEDDHKKDDNGDSVWAEAAITLPFCFACFESPIYIAQPREPNNTSVYLHDPQKLNATELIDPYKPSHLTIKMPRSFYHTTTPRVLQGFLA